MLTNVFSIFVSFIFPLSINGGSKARTQPNIIFMLMDDIGWNDVGFNDGQFPTPNIDSLRTEGVSLNRHYIHLMCSPSRSQMITGRYAMYQGFGKMLPWDYTEIGGLPQGQPTIASWLQWGGYTTYGVGKWHMGYAADLLLPTDKGFDHFFGFYQGAIHYDNLKYIDIKYGDSNHFDFWEDGAEQKVLANEIAERHESINQYTINKDLGLPVDGHDFEGQSIFDDNTMYLYRDKILQYIDDEIYNENGKLIKHKNRKPFYMYLALQTIHGPLNEVPEKMDDCAQILPWDATNRRHKYCQNMLLTDDVIGDIINKLKENDDVWENTVVVFTSDNGGDVANKGCNYPLRGTKGTLFDGNLKTIALVSGGVVPEEQYGTSRDVLFSSLDWTPTLLKYANLLNKIEKKDFTWDGQNQYDLIQNNDLKKKRDHIVMNIGLKSLESASIVFEYKDKLYKYVSKDDKIDRWAYIRDDGWCVPDENGNFALILDEEVSLAHAVDNKFLFDLTSDIAEKVNLFQYDGDAFNDELVEYAKSILHGYTEHYLYSEPLTFLWNRLPAGDPTNLGDGSFVSPFLEEKDYIFHIRKGFHAIDAQTEEKAEELGVDVTDINRYSKALQGTYFNVWTPPDALPEDDLDELDDEEEAVDAILKSAPTLSKSSNHINVWLIMSIIMLVCIAGGYEYYKKRGGNDGYKQIDVSDERTALIKV